jgi:hypothetical protein
MLHYSTVFCDYSVLLLCGIPVILSRNKAALYSTPTYQHSTRDDK